MPKETSHKVQHASHANKLPKKSQAVKNKPLDQDDVVWLFKAISDLGNNNVDLNNPQGTQIIDLVNDFKELLDESPEYANATMKQKIEVLSFPNNKKIEVTVTPLMWALYLYEGKNASKITQYLISKGADASFISPEEDFHAFAFASNHPDRLEVFKSLFSSLPDDSTRTLFCRHHQYAIGFSGIKIGGEDVKTVYLLLTQALVSCGADEIAALKMAEIIKTFKGLGIDLNCSKVPGSNIKIPHPFANLLQGYHIDEPKHIATQTRNLAFKQLTKEGVDPSFLDTDAAKSAGGKKLPQDIRKELHGIYETEGKKNAVHGKFTRDELAAREKVKSQGCIIL